VANAESHGATGLRVDSPAEVDDTLAAALDHDGPVVVDVPVTDR
jgi:thiamine pyrophosphate-dependent acetolactate synthase large subunit-like protein